MKCRAWCTNCGNDIPCIREQEDEWERAFIAPLENDSMRPSEIPKPTLEQQQDLENRYMLKRCDIKVKEKVYHVANQIVQRTKYHAQRIHKIVRSNTLPRDNISIFPSMVDSHVEITQI